MLNIRPKPGAVLGNDRWNPVLGLSLGQEICRSSTNAHIERRHSTIGPALVVEQQPTVGDQCWPRRRADAVCSCSAYAQMQYRHAIHCQSYASAGTSSKSDRWHSAFPPTLTRSWTCDIYIYKYLKS